MNAVDVLRVQLRGACDLVAEHAGSVEPVWLERASPATSLPGFIVWHCARIIDWGVNTCVRDEPEVAAESPWREKLRYEMGHGAGLTDVEADEVAATVAPGDVVEYAHALRDGIDQWMADLVDADLERTIDVRMANQAHARYSTPAAWEEVKHLDGAQAWQLLIRPCGGHIRMHMGELETLARLIQSRQRDTA